MSVLSAIGRVISKLGSGAEDLRQRMQHGEDYKEKAAFLKRMAELKAATDEQQLSADTERTQHLKAAEARAAAKSQLEDVIQSASLRVAGANANNDLPEGQAGPPRPSSVPEPMNPRWRGASGIREEDILKAEADRQEQAKIDARLKREFAVSREAREQDTAGALGEERRARARNLDRPKVPKGPREHVPFVKRPSDYQKDARTILGRDAEPEEIEAKADELQQDDQDAVDAFKAARGGPGPPAAATPKPKPAAAAAPKGKVYKYGGQLLPFEQLPPAIQAKVKAKGL